MFKRNSLTQNENLLTITSQATEDLDELVSSSEQIWKKLVLHHLLMDGQTEGQMDGWMEFCVTQSLQVGV